MKKAIAAVVILFAFPLVYIICKGNGVHNAAFFKPATSEITEYGNKVALQDSFLPILGRWKIARFINGDVSTVPDDKVIKDIMSKTILFTWRMSVMLNDTCYTPVYDSKKYVRTEFLFKFLGQQNDLGIKGDTINVARLKCSGRTVLRGNIPENNYYYRFIIMDDHTLLIPYKGNFLLLNKVSEKIKAVVAAQKPAEVKKANQPVVAAKAAVNTGSFNYGKGAFDPFNICTDLINSAIKEAKVNNK